MIKDGIPAYNDKELRRLRSVIEDLPLLTTEATLEAVRAVETGRCPPHLAPWWTLASSVRGNDFDSRLFHKLEADPIVAEYSCYSFFPPICAPLYERGERPQVWFDGRSRGRVAMFRFTKGECLVVKPLQSRGEKEIAQLAGELEVGPRQLPSMEGFLVGEFVDGRFFTEFAAGGLDEDLAWQVGRKLGSMLSALHDAGICYNDATLSDAEGRSHLLVELPDSISPGRAPNCKLIDFGVSVSLDRLPDLEREEVFNLLRTTPEYRLVARLGLQGAELDRLLAQYCQRLAAATQEEILARDLRFTEEGLQQAARRLGPGIVAPFQQGFNQGYSR